MAQNLKRSGHTDLSKRLGISLVVESQIGTSPPELNRERQEDFPKVKIDGSKPLNPIIVTCEVSLTRNILLCHQLKWPMMLFYKDTFEKFDFLQTWAAYFRLSLYYESLK